MGYQYRGTTFTEPEIDKTPFVEFDPSRCGTSGGWKQHRRHGIEACQPCKDAINAYYRDYKRRRKVGNVRTAQDFNPDMCGTTTGYSRHKRKKEPMCQPCREARLEWRLEYEDRKKAA